MEFTTAAPTALPEGGRENGEGTPGPEAAPLTTNRQTGLDSRGGSRAGAPPQATDPPRPSSSQPAAAPRLAAKGRYTYRASHGDRMEEVTETYSDVTTASGEQRQTVQLSDRGGSEERSLQSTGLWLLSWRSGGPTAKQFTQKWDPPAQLLPATLRPGATSRSQSKYARAEGSSHTQWERTDEVNVDRAEDVVVDGVTVPTWVVRRHTVEVSTTTFSGSATVSTQQPVPPQRQTVDRTGTYWYAPSVGLSVRSEETVRVEPTFRGPSAGSHTPASSSTCSRGSRARRRHRSLLRRSRPPLRRPR